MHNAQALSLMCRLIFCTPDRDRQTGKLWIKYKHLDYISRRIINVQYNINVASDSNKKKCPKVGIIAYIRDGKTLILSLPDMLMLL